MTRTAKHATDRIEPFEDNEAVRHLRQSILAGKHWYLALLEAISKWTMVAEMVDGRAFHYLIAGEAFDWLLLAERLCQTVDGLIPEDEKVRLLFQGKAPVNLTNEEFQILIGPAKYKQYLNFFYGVTVEEALLLAVEEEVTKERQATIWHREKDYSAEAYRRIYGAEWPVLLTEFRHEKGFAQTDSTSLTEMREFTYWLFKYRVSHTEPVKVASDTKKAMDFLKVQYVRTLRAGSYQENR